MPSAPLGISSQSRKKLNAFAFDERLLAADDDKENQNNESAASRIGQAETVCKETPNSKTPHTPAVRIPIEDLIANTEDAYNCAPPLATPIDHVLWQSRPDGSDISGAAGATQMSRKRAHSSSPVSSQQVSVQKEALDLDTLKRSLRSPINDPTQDLWNRYTTVHGLKKDSKEPVLPAYAHLLPSSPQTPSTTGKDGGMRRTHSCGVEWPTSKPKRRRLHEQHSRTKELFAASRKDILARDLSNPTRVGLLLDKIQESMIKKTDAPESPSSSSPLPDRRSQGFGSPTRPPYSSRGESKGPSSALHSPQKSSPLKNGTSRDASFSSEFSDEGFDAEAIECFEEIMAKTQHDAHASISHVLEDPAKERDVSQHRSTVKFAQNDGTAGLSQRHSSAQPVATTTNLAPVVELDEFDEFNEDDDDDLMNEMLDLAAKYDSQGQVMAEEKPAIAQPTSQINTQSKHLETLDEFDDAFDDDDEMWQGIANATPKGRTPVGSSRAVCFD